MTESKRPAWLVPLALLLLAVAVAFAILLLAPKSKAHKAASGATESGKREDPSVVQLGQLDDLARPAVWLEVHDAAALRKAVRENVWLQQILKEPLGQGFAGAWAAFLGSRGEDLKADFKGTVLDYFLDSMLDGPFRVIWFGGATASRTPAVVIDSPSGTAFWALDKIAAKQTLAAKSCPGAAPPADPEQKKAEGGADKKPAEPKKPSPDEIQISKWVVAEHSMFAARKGDKVALAAHPAAVLQGLCTEIERAEPPKGTELELVIAGEPLGRDVQELFSLVGVGKTARFGFGIQGTQVVPRGIRAALEHGGRLEAAPVSDELLKLVPEDVPALATLQLKLPDKLEPQALKKYFDAEAPQAGGTVARQVILLWQPRADSNATELALVWSRPEDAESLKAIFAGAALQHSTVCGKPVVSSSPALTTRMETACAGKAPSVLHAAGPVAAGLRAKSSVAVGVNLGRLLSGLTREGYRSEQTGAAKEQIPPEIQAALKRLEELPFIGLTGTAEGEALVPGGFKS